jgi:plastocyanin
MIFCGIGGIMFKELFAAIPIIKQHDMKKLMFILAALCLTAALVVPLRAAAKPAKPVTHSVTIKGMKYTPASITIKAGDSVEWDNGDQRDHTVVAADGSFTSGNIGPGATFSFRFTKPGKYEYSCTLHPRMRGVVIVQ